ncbi:MAG: response regulator [Ferruginibacter sp.]
MEKLINKAFIIDDEMDICFLLSSLLRQKKITAEFAGTIKEAKTVLESKEPELIFLDNHLPDGLGVNFISKIKELHPSTKVVMITADDTPADRDKAMAAGADYFLGKPFSKDVINRIVDNLPD